MFSSPDLSFFSRAWKWTFPLLLLTSGEAALSEDVTSMAAEGKAVLETHCARCHAIEREGSSPLAQAPPFRNVYRKFPREELEMRLTEGAVSHYKDMPQIDLTHDQVQAVMAYLASINIESSQ